MFKVWLSILFVCVFGHFKLIILISLLLSACATSIFSTYFLFFPILFVYSSMFLLVNPFFHANLILFISHFFQTTYHFIIHCWLIFCIHWSLWVFYLFFIGGHIWKQFINLTIRARDHPASPLTHLYEIWVNNIIIIQKPSWIFYCYILIWYMGPKIKNYNGGQVWITWLHESLGLWHISKTCWKCSG